MTDLRALARGKPCYARFPGHCSHNPEQTVLGHFRLGGIAGTGQKAPDICGMPVCLPCHDVLDGRAKTFHSRAQVHADALRGFCQWLAWLYAQGFIKT